MVEAVIGRHGDGIIPPAKAISGRPLFYKRRGSGTNRAKLRGSSGFCPQTWTAIREDVRQPPSSASQRQGRRAPEMRPVGRAIETVPQRNEVLRRMPSPNKDRVQRVRTGARRPRRQDVGNLIEIGRQRQDARKFPCIIGSRRSEHKGNRIRSSREDRGWSSSWNPPVRRNAVIAIAAARSLSSSSLGGAPSRSVCFATVRRVRIRRVRSGGPTFRKPKQGFDD